MNRIVTISHAAFKHGGHTRHKEIVNSLIAKGYSVGWIGPNKKDVSNIAGLDFLQLELYSFRKIPFVGILLYSYFNLVKYKSILRQRVYVSLNEFDLLAAVFFNKTFGNNLTIYFLQRSDIIIKSQIELIRNANIFVKLKYQFRIYLIKFIYRYCLPKISKCIVQTDYHKKRLLKYTKNISIVPNNVNTSWVKDVGNLRKPSWFNRTEGCHVAVISNLFYKIKGFDLLIDSLSLLQDMNLNVYIIGDGVDREYIESEFANANLSQQTVFVGRVDNASRLMKIFDLLIVPTYYDDCPNVVLEAMYNEIPFVATDIDAHRFLLGAEFPLINQNANDFSSKIREMLIGEGGVKHKELELAKKRTCDLTFDWGQKMLEELNLDA